MKVFILDWNYPTKDSEGVLYMTSQRKLFATKEAAEKHKDLLNEARKFIGMSAFVLYVHVMEIEVED